MKTYASFLAKLSSVGYIIQRKAKFSKYRNIYSLNIEIFFTLVCHLCGSGTQEVFMRQTVQTGKVFERVNMKIAEKYRV